MTSEHREHGVLLLRMSLLLVAGIDQLRCAAQCLARVLRHAAHRRWHVDTLVIHAFGRGMLAKLMVHGAG